MGGADFCKFSHAFRHGLLLSERILQISPGKNDNLPLMATTSTVWGSGSIGLSLVAQSRPPQISLLCGFCPLAREFALRRTFQPPQSDFLQIPPRDGHPCLWLTVPATESVVDFHHQVVAHAGRTQNADSRLLPKESAVVFSLSNMNGKTPDFNPGMKVNSLFPRMFL